ncbi:MAG: hypothetical protein H6863_01325 [Rhodospirillales bacterium]|nr:hypothetical protein [Rhodospirillales bacterium]
MNYEPPGPLEGFKFILLLIALVLIGTGASLGLFYAYLVYQVFTNPGEVGLVSYLQTLLAQNGLGSNLLSGNIDGHPISLEISNAAVTFAVIFLGLIGLQIFAIVARTLIEGGAAIFRIFTPKSPKSKK